jgi:hypothetical protein
MKHISYIEMEEPCTSHRHLQNTSSYPIAIMRHIDRYYAYCLSFDRIPVVLKPHLTHQWPSRQRELRQTANSAQGSQSAVTILLPSCSHHEILMEYPPISSKESADTLARNSTFSSPMSPIPHTQLAHEFPPSSPRTQLRFPHSTAKLTHPKTGSSPHPPEREFPRLAIIIYSVCLT